MRNKQEKNMTERPSFDTMLASLAAQTASNHHDGVMEGVWQRAGQLGEIADRRRRAALFCGLFAVGLVVGVGTAELPYRAGSEAHVAAAYDFSVSERLSPSALLEGRY